MILRRVWVIALLTGAVMAHAANPTEGASAVPPPSDQLIPLLLSNRFDELSSRLARVQADYESDQRREGEVHKLVDEFFRADPAIERPLDRWVAERPNDAFGYLARGVYRTRMGWVARGTDWSAKTSSKQFKGMATWFDQAKDDLNQALRRKRTLVDPYYYLMGMDMTDGGKNLPKLYEQALAINPTSLVVRDAALQSLLPRWGGSYEAMAQLMESAKPHYGQMPRLVVLEGKMLADMGDRLRISKDLERSRQVFAQAVSKGDFWFTNERYGKLLYEVDDYAGALEQFTKVVNERPAYKQGWWWRSQAYKMLGKFPEALSDINRAIRIEPNDDEAIAARGHLYNGYRMPAAALPDFEAAARLNPSERSYQQMIETIKQTLDKRR